MIYTGNCLWKMSRPLPSRPFPFTRESQSTACNLCSCSRIWRSVISGYTFRLPNFLNSCKCLLKRRTYFKIYLRFHVKCDV
jgi:hypothetical protein